MFEPEKLIQKYEKLNPGEARLSGIRYAIEQADFAKDYSYMLYFRYIYADSCGEYEDGLLRHIYYVFPEMLRLFEEHPDVLMPDFCYVTAEHAVWEIFYQVVNCGDYFYQISLSDMEQYLAKFKSFSLAYGYDLNSYYVSGARFYRDSDPQKSKELFEAYKQFNKDRHIVNATTIAFECEMEVCFGNVEKALEIIKPLMNGTYHDDWRLCCEYGRFFCYYMRIAPDMEKAGKFYRLMEKLRKKLRTSPLFFSDTVLYLTLTDFDAAWNFYKKGAYHEAKSTIPMQIIDFAAATVIMMKYLRKHGRDEVHLRFPKNVPYYRADGCYQTQELASCCDRQARDLCRRFDERNGTLENIDDYRNCLKAAKLWDEETGLIDLV